MSRATVLAWGIWVAFVAVLAGATYAGFHPAPGLPPIQLLDAVWAASFIGFPTAGALVVSRMPRRPLGWMLLVAPTLLMGGVLLSDLAQRSPMGAEASSEAAWTLWASALTFGVGLAMLVPIPLLLPNGELPSRRWRPVGYAVVGIGILSTLNAAFRPGPLESTSSQITNPLGVDALAPLFEVINAAVGPLFLLTLATGFASLVVRYRKAAGIQRQQLKWLALGGAGIVIPFMMLAAYEAFSGNAASDEVATLIIVVAILSLPTAIAVAVLKTRLYDVDVIINRALVYGALTAILAFSYLGSVVVLQRLLGPVTRESDLAVAGSTLAVAALFRPIRARLQSFIDHRFYRRKYDAAETLGAFSSRLRDQVDLESLRRELVGLVGATMQPAHASLWLRRETLRD